MQEGRLEMTCNKCGRRSEVFFRFREDGFNEWESVHCAWCGLKIDDIQSACTPKSVLIADAPADNNEGEDMDAEEDE